MDVVGGFESTYLPRHDVDVTETTGHHDRVADLDLAAGDLGLRWLRYPVRWHRVEARRGRYDWDHTDRVLDALRARQVTPILDLLHHTSYPRWLARGLGDRRFAESYLAFVTAVAERYGWVGGVTLMNEPFGTAWLAGHEGVWPPHRRGPAGLVRVLERTLPALAEASRRWAELAPRARHFHTETAEAHTADPRLDPASGLAGHAAMADARRFVATDLLVGRTPDPAAAEWLARAGGERLLALAPGRVDVLGLDYYAHHEWWYGPDGGRSPSPEPRGLARIAAEYAARYPGLDLWVGETNVRGFFSDRCTWLRHTVDQCERAIAAGVPLTAYCWYPTVDSADWDSLLTRADGHVDPVGIYWLDERLDRRASPLSDAYAALAAGARAAELPAYRLSAPLDRDLAGFVALMDVDEWQDPPP